MRFEWPGVIDPATLKSEYVDEANRLADAAKAGRWAEAVRLIEAATWIGPNQWRVTGTSWFTPLHQAAWLGAPREVVERLLELGSWRSLRTADGDRAYDLALKRGHGHLRELLAGPEPSPRQLQTYAAWDRHLLDLVNERTRSLAPVRIRPVATEVVESEGLDSIWFPYPGMYGGFSLSMHKGRLFVESWCRVAGGSGQAHVITEGACVLVEEGFV